MQSRVHIPVLLTCLMSTQLAVAGSAAPARSPEKPKIMDNASTARNPRADPKPSRPSFVATGNPVMAGADPHAVIIDQKMWIYPTQGLGDHTRFFAFASADLKHWDTYGPVLEFKDVSWINDDGSADHSAWAPAVFQAPKGRFYFYYAVGPQGATPSRIGVGVGDSPAGPFKDSGKPLLTGGNGFEAIDPTVFVDPRSGKAFLYAGGSAGATLRVFELGHDWMSIAREIKVKTPPQFTEGVFMHYRKGTYYLSYSHGGWRDASYSVHYATSKSPTGPWEYRGALLTSDDRHKGPGHHSFVKIPGKDEWYIVYHRWNDRSGSGPFRGSREIAIDRVEFDADGLIKPVKMTDSVPPFSLK